MDTLILALLMQLSVISPWLETTVDDGKMIFVMEPCTLSNEVATKARARTVGQYSGGTIYISEEVRNNRAWKGRSKVKLCWRFSDDSQTIEGFDSDGDTFAIPVGKIQMIHPKPPAATKRI